MLIGRGCSRMDDMLNIELTMTVAVPGLAVQEREKLEAELNHLP